MSSRPTFRAEFRRVRPMAKDPDGYRQLRWTLKRLLRLFGWECVAAIEVEEPQETKNPADARTS